MRGFDDVLDRTLLHVFDYQELQLLLCGLPDVDVDDWKRHAKYLGAFRDRGEAHPVVAAFWRAVEDFDADERARVLQFATGAARVPPAGFKALVGDDGGCCDFTLAPLPRSLGPWPRAHTCFNRVDLPLYERPDDEVQHYLALSIHLEIAGFTID